MRASGIGARLRAARMQRGLSLRSLASSLGVSASLVSQVETGKTQPSVSTLYAIANHLGVSLDELLGIVPTSSLPAPTMFGHAGAAMPDVQRASDNPIIEMENGVRWERLAVGSGGPADAILVVYEPGASSSVDSKLMRHAGVEYAYVLEGRLRLQLDFDSYDLGPGDSLQFESMRPHMFSNPGDTIAKGVWFVFGRRGQSVPDSDAEPIGFEELGALRH